MSSKSSAIWQIQFISIQTSDWRLLEPKNTSALVLKTSNKVQGLTVRLLQKNMGGC